MNKIFRLSSSISRQPRRLKLLINLEEMRSLGTSLWRPVSCKLSGKNFGLVFVVNPRGADLIVLLTKL